MKLSIITINYNNAEGLRKTLASVAEQTYRDIEHIIIDGGSTDHSVEVIKEYAKKVESQEPRAKSVIWVSEKDNGIYDGMNRGILKAAGEYVWILNSGDCAAGPDVVERMMAVLESTENRGIDMLLGNIVKLKPREQNAKIRNLKVESVTPRVMDVSMLTFYTGTVPQDAAFIMRDLFDKYGLFDDKLKIVSDWKLYLNMIALGDIQPMYVDIDLVLFDMTGISNSHMDQLKAEKRAYLEEVLPVSVLKDYDAYAFPIEQYKRLKKYHLWGLVWFIERVLFKLEKWRILK